jgi:hypothetical protein
MEYIKTAHSIYYLQYHVVWVFKYRGRILKPAYAGIFETSFRCYFVSSVSVDEETIKKYVELQGRQDSGQIQLKL